MESKRERVFYLVIMPIASAIIGALVGAVATAWFQATTTDAAQIDSVTTLLKDVSLTPQQKMRALEIYKEISDRPWSIVRSLTGSLTTVVLIAVGAMVAGGFFVRQSR